MTINLLPMVATLESIEHAVPDHQLFRFRPAQPLVLAPGQFIELSLPGIGAFPVSTAAWPNGELVECCIRRAGRVTAALYNLSTGAEVGIRGPFGNGYPLSAFLGQDVLLLAGGLGMAPLRALLHWLLTRRAELGTLTLLYGCREVSAFLFREELQQLAETGQISLRFSVDFAEAIPAWVNAPVVCQIGLVNELLDGLIFNPERTIAALCGPPALYQCILEELACRGIAPEQIYATLERRMQCGVGECCHCVTAGIYLCSAGPVFSLAQLRQMEGAI